MVKSSKDSTRRHRRLVERVGTSATTSFLFFPHSALGIHRSGLTGVSPSHHLASSLLNRIDINQSKPLATSRLSSAQPGGVLTHCYSDRFHIKAAHSSHLLVKKKNKTAGTLSCNYYVKIWNHFIRHLSAPVVLGACRAERNETKVESSFYDFELSLFFFNRFDMDQSIHPSID